MAFSGPYWSVGEINMGKDTRKRGTTVVGGRMQQTKAENIQGGEKKASEREILKLTRDERKKSDGENQIRM